MNLRNRYLIHTLRTIFGLFMIFSGVAGLMMGPEAPDIPQNILEMNRALWNSGILQMIKTTEAIAGIMLVLNFLPALAIIFLAPVSIGIIIVNSMLTPEFLPLGIVVCLFEIYFGYIYWDQYKPLFKKSK